MPADAPGMASEAPSGAGWGHPTGEGPQRAVCELWGRPRRPGPAGWGVRPAEGGPEQLRNVGVAKIPELKM